MISKVKDRLLICLFYCFRVFPINNNKIVISMFNGKGYGSEGKSIAQRLLCLKEKYDIVWVCQNTQEAFPEGIRRVKYNSIRYFYDYVTAKVWIDNQRKSLFFRKRKEQFYIQTWHGNICIKKIEADAKDTLPPRYVEAAKNDSKMANLIVSGSEWRTKNIQSAFWYKGEILKGDLYSMKEREKRSAETYISIRKALGLGKEDKIILYAPTFRQDSRLDCYDINIMDLNAALQKKYGGRWKTIIRLHPNISSLSKTMTYNEQIIDGSDFPQIYDLVVACDLLITDYSGVMFDAFRNKKRVIIYASDYDKYIMEERGLYFDMRLIPAPMAKTNNELMKIISDFDDNHYEKNRMSFVDSIGYYTNDASYEITERIIKIVKGKGV